MRTQFFIEHEQYRKDTWEPLKHFRDRYDSEKMAENILEPSEMQKKKKEFDKLILNSVRLSIMADEPDKVFQYIEMLHFTQSLKLCVKLCDSLQQRPLANKVSQYLRDREQRTLMEQSSTHKKPVVEKFDSKQVGNCMSNPVIEQEAPKNELAHFAVNNNHSQTQ